MKALVLCGGIPQIALMKYLKEKKIEVVLADMNENVVGKKHCDTFYPVSVLDVKGIKEVAIKEKVDFIITVCADQVLQVVAQVSEELGLPWYIDYETAENVSNKSYMKKIFLQNNIPTSKYVICDTPSEENFENLKYPLIVKPVDSYSSRGVKKVETYSQLVDAFSQAKNISRTNRVIVEEFVIGDEVTVDVYVENGVAKVLCASNIYKIADSEKFVIHRTLYPARITQNVYKKIETAAQDIANAFGLYNSPMLIQLITDGEDISVVEFCARTGGGDKFRLIEKVSGFDVVKAVAQLSLGSLPHVEKEEENPIYILNEFLYCKEGIFSHLEGFDELLSKGIITEYYQLKNKGTEFNSINSSGDRVAYYTIEAKDEETLIENQKLVNKTIKAISISGEDMLRHDLIAE